MKKSFLLLPFIAGFAYMTLTSNSTGYTVNNVTGSDGASVTGCAGSSCHGTAATTSITPTFILDSAGTVVTKYTPGKNYTIRFGALNATTSMLPAFGFQLSVVKSSAFVTAGTMGTVAGTTTFGSGIIVMVQTAPMAPTTGSGGAGTIYGVSVPWTAPVAGTGAIKIYGVINLVDSNGSASSADKWNSGSVTIQERTVSGVEEVGAAIELNAYPNPVINNLNLRLNTANAGTYNIHVFDMNGRLMTNQLVESLGASNAVINMQNFAPGMYQVVVNKDGMRKAISVIKQ